MAVELSMFFSMIARGNVTIIDVCKLDFENITSMRLYNKKCNEMGSEVIVMESGDMPYPSDHNGDGITDVAVWRSSNGKCYIKGKVWPLWGSSGNIPLVK